VRKKNDRKAAQEEIKLQKRQEKEQEKAAREEAKMQKQQDKFMAKVQQQKAPKDLPFPVSYEYVGKLGTEGE
jgi:GTP cyclohydrolase III